jgi:hypothetical protein
VLVVDLGECGAEKLQKLRPERRRRVRLAIQVQSLQRSDQAAVQAVRVVHQVRLVAGRQQAKGRPTGLVNPVPDMTASGP